MLTIVPSEKKWNFDKNENISFQENAFYSTFCKMLGILFKVHDQIMSCL